MPNGGRGSSPAGRLIARHGAPREPPFRRGRAAKAAIGAGKPKAFYSGEISAPMLSSILGRVLRKRHEPNSGESRSKSSGGRAPVPMLMIFLKDEGGAITTDWVALTSALIIVAIIIVFTLFSGGITPLSNTINEQIESGSAEICNGTTAGCDVIQK